MLTPRFKSCIGREDGLKNEITILKKYPKRPKTLREDLKRKHQQNFLTGRGIEIWKETFHLNSSI